MKRIARIVSDILSPVTWVPFIQYILVMKTSKTPELFRISMTEVLFFMMVIPAVLFIYFMKKKQITDIDITNRKERFGLLAGSLISMSLLLMGLLYIGNHILFRWELILMIILLFNFLITLMWKISFHMAVNIVGCLIVILFFGWSFSWIFTVIPLVAWSRLILKKHTPAQLAAAFFLNSMVLLTGYVTLIR